MIDSGRHLRLEDGVCAPEVLARRIVVDGEHRFVGPGRTERDRERDHERNERERLAVVVRDPDANVAEQIGDGREVELAVELPPDEHGIGKRTERRIEARHGRHLAAVLKGRAVIVRAGEADQGLGLDWRAEVIERCADRSADRVDGDRRFDLRQRRTIGLLRVVVDVDVAADQRLRLRRGDTAARARPLTSSARRRSPAARSPARAMRPSTRRSRPKPQRTTACDGTENARVVSWRKALVTEVVSALSPSAECNCA